MDIYCANIWPVCRSPLLINKCSKNKPREDPSFSKSAAWTGLSQKRNIQKYNWRILEVKKLLRMILQWIGSNEKMWGCKNADLGFFTALLHSHASWFCPGIKSVAFSDILILFSNDALFMYVSISYFPRICLLYYPRLSCCHLTTSFPFQLLPLRIAVEVFNEGTAFQHLVLKKSSMLVFLRRMVMWKMRLKCSWSKLGNNSHQREKCQWWKTY